jgi:8-oxo-dGTP pyrophosphatase MutT (NUDIX family)
VLQLIAERLLGLLPASWHRVALRRAHAVRVVWWRVRKPRIEACRVLALDTQGRVLLVRHAYGPPKWMPPGGGMKRGEQPIPAAMRELAEELGCTLAYPRITATAFDTLHGAGNVLHIVAGECVGTPAPDQREIIEAQFFAPDALPEDCARGLAQALPRWLA